MGSHAKQQNQLLDTARNKSNSQYDTQYDTLNNRSNSAYNNAQGTRGDLSGKLSNVYDTGGIDPEELNRLRSTFGTGNGSGSGYGGGGGSSVANELASTGGINQGAFTDALAGYSKYAHGGGIDADAIRQRANSAIPGFFADLKNNMAKRRMQNPYAPSYDDAEAKMSRDAAQQTQNNMRDTELDIADKKAGYEQFGIKGLGDLNSTIQGMLQSGKIAGGQQQISNANVGLGYAGLNEEAAARRQRGESDIMSAQQSGRLKGLGGISDLYGSDSDQAGNYATGTGSNINSRAGSNVNNINSRQDPGSWWKTLAGYAARGTADYFTGGGYEGLRKATSSRSNSSVDGR